MIAKIFEIISRVIGIYTFIISLVEEELSGKPGAEKKQQAIIYVQQYLRKLAEEGEIPLWVVGIFGSNFVLGNTIDFLVKCANEHGFFQKSSPQE